MQVEWIKCQNNDWCKLSTVNLAHEHFNDMEGVYIIWHGGSGPNVVRLGQGVIKDRLQAHRNDEDVQAYSHLGLNVTWASVAKRSRDGVEAYLDKELKPKVGERAPNVTPIPVNLPQ
jgi:hypothetical protein